MKKQQLPTELQEPNLLESDFEILKKATGILNRYFDGTEKTKKQNTEPQNDSAKSKMKLQELLQELQSLTLTELLDLYLEAKTGKEIYIEDSEIEHLQEVERAIEDIIEANQK
jgi:hypothetical protein